VFSSHSVIVNREETETGRIFAFLKQSVRCPDFFIIQSKPNGVFTMRRFFSLLTVMVFVTGTAFSACPERQTYQPVPSTPRAEGAPEICLESFEMCNNWARHYCRPGNHEQMVNHILQGMKERGMTITTAVIKSVAKRTLKNTEPPAKPTAE